VLFFVALTGFLENSIIKGKNTWGRHMKKFFQIILGISFLFLLVGCSSQEIGGSNSQETATFIQKLELAEFSVTYTYDKKNDTVTKIKTELKQSAEFTEARKENEKLFEELKGIDGVVTSITEKDGQDIFSVEVDLTKYTLSKLKESNSSYFIGLVQHGFLTGTGDKVSFSKSKKATLQNGYTEQTK